MPNRFDWCWRWGPDRTDAPWYPTLRMFRQRTFGDWAAVVTDIAGTLAKPRRGMAVDPPWRRRRDRERASERA
jgi:hypothetical protein